ncbi:MAG: hypothetical protein ACE5KM_14265 [Planctomycetaceae bacterium]
MTAQAPTDLQHELTEGFAGRYIRRKARQLMGHGGLKDADVRDIEQHLALAVFRASPDYVPANGHWRAFVATVVERRADQLVKKRNRKIRRAQHATTSLHDRVDGPDGEDTLSDLLREEHREALTGRYAPSHVELIDTVSDVRHVSATLPEYLQRVCRLLSEKSQREVAEELGISRRRLRERIEEIRAHFEAHGFEES